MTHLWVSCDRSATLCSSAAERATYCRAPFHAHVCQTSPGVVSSPSALVSQQSLWYCSSIFLLKWKTHPSAEGFALPCWHKSCLIPHTHPAWFFLWKLFLLRCDIPPSYLSLFRSFSPHISVTPPSFSPFALLCLIFLALPQSFSLQPTTVASRSYQPSLMCEPLNCHPSATRSSIRVSLASIWPEDQSTGPAGLMEAGLGSPLSVQVSTWLHSTQIGRCHVPYILVFALVWLVNLVTQVCKWVIKVMLI